MSRLRAVALLVAVASVGSACDRMEPEPPEGDSTGTFEAEARALSGGGFEILEGPATFEVEQAADGTPVFSVRLLSKLPNAEDSTVLHLVSSRPAVPAGDYGFSDPAEPSTDLSAAFAGCYRSPNFESVLYLSESGSLSVTAASDARIEGTLDMSVYTRFQTGPGTFGRSRLVIRGTFKATARESTVPPGAVLACVP